MNEVIAIRPRGFHPPLLLDKTDVEPLTRNTWKELLLNKNIPSVLLAIATLKTQNGELLTKTYEATNLREHLKIAGFVDPLTRLPIEGINWVYAQTFNLDEKANIDYSNENEFHPIDDMSDCLFEPMRNQTNSEFSLVKTKNIFLQAFKMESPLPHDWVNSTHTAETQIKLQSEIFSRNCNPSLPHETRAKAQFVTGLSLLEELKHPPESWAPPKKKDRKEMLPATHRTARSDEGVRNLICAGKNGHGASSALVSMLYQGYCGLLPTRGKKASRLILKALAQIKEEDSRPPTPRSPLPNIGEPDKSLKEP